MATCVLNKALTYLILLVLVIPISQGIHAQTLTLQCEQPTGCAPHGVVIAAAMSDGSAVGGTTWTITGPNGITLQSSANPYVAIFNTPGFYGITVTTSLGFSQVFNDFITVFAKPSAALTVSDPAGCLPFCIEFQDASILGSGLIVEWGWDFGDGSFSSSANPSHCYAEVGSFTPVLSVEDNNGCFSSISMPQLIQTSNQAPHADFTVGSQSSCSLPTSINFSADQTNYSDYSWFVNGNATNQNTSVASIQFTESTIYRVCLAVENAIGCVDTTCRDITISSQPSVGFTSTSDTTCAGQTLQFTNITSPAPTSVEWDYNGDGITDGATMHGGYTFSNDGIAVIRMTAHFGAACTVAFTDTITAMPNPTIDFTASITSACAVPLEVYFTNGAANQSNSEFIWFINNQEVSNDVHLTYVFTEVGDYDVKLRRISEVGCTRNRIRNNYVHIETPSLSFQHAEAICIGETMEVTDILVSTGESIEIYSWDFTGDGLEDATGANPIYVFNEAGEYFPSLTVTTIGGCVAAYTSEVPLSVLVPVIPDFTVSQTLGCAGINFEFCLDYQPGNIYIWDFNDGSGPMTMQEDDSCLSRAFEDTGYFDVSLAILNGACNVGLTRENFIRVVPPLALFSYEVTCTEFGVQFTNESIEGDSLIWDFGDNSPFVINEANPLHHYATLGQYTVTLIAYKNGDSCSDSKTELVHVSTPTARLDITPVIGCSPLEVHIDNPRSNVHWEVNVENGDQVVIDRVYNPSAAPWTIIYTHNGQSSTGYSEDPMHFDWPTLLFEEAGIYDVQVSATNYQGCSADTTYLDVVTVLQGGDFSDFSYTVVNPCASEGVVVSFNSTSPQATAWNWTMSDGSSDTLAAVQHVFTTPFNYSSGLSATLTASNPDGCQSTHTMVIETVLPPVAQFDIDDTDVCRWGLVSFNNTSIAPNASAFAWSFGENASPSFNENAEYTYQSNGSYEVCLTATNAIGCSNTYCHPTLVHVQSPDAEASVIPVINNCLYTVSFDNITSGNITQTHWNFGDSQSGMGQHVAHTYSIGVFDVEMITTSANGCADTLNVPDVLDYSSSVGPFNQFLDSVSCAPFDVSFEAFNVGDNSFEYFWDFNDGQGEPFGGTATAHTYTTPGEYCPSIIMTDQNGCDVYIHCASPFVVTNYQAQYAIPVHICEGDLIEIVGINADQISWDESSLLSAGTQPNVAVMQTGVSSDLVITAGLADCISVDTIHISVLPKPAVSLQLVDSICYNSGSIELQGGSPVGNTGHYFINSLEVDSLNSLSTPGLHQLVEYHYTTDLGCVGMATDSVFILPPPTIEPLIQQSFCDGDDDYVFASDSMVQSHYTVNGVMTEVFEPIFNVSPYTIELHYFDNHGCYSSSSTEYNVRPRPILDVVSPDVCSGQEVNLHVNSSVEVGQIAELNWTLDGISMGSESTLNGLTFAQGGDHHGLVDALSNFGCVAQQTFGFMVYDTPLASFALANACEKDSVMFVDESTFGNDSVVAWVWFAGGNQWIDDDTTFYTFDNSGPATVGLHISSAHGCTHVSQRQIIVRPMPQIILHTENHCLGEPTDFVADVAIAYGGISSTAWTIENYPFTSVGYTTEYLFDSAGVYDYSIVVTSSYGCQINVVDSVEVYPLPTAEILFNHTELCSNQMAIAECAASISLPSSIQSYEWFLDGEIITNSNPAHITIGEIGAYNLDVAVHSNRGCVTHVSMSEPVVVYPTPEAGFTWVIDQSTATPTVLVSQAISPDATVVGYNWGDGSEGTNDTQHVYSEDGVYEITQLVTNTFGCTAQFVQAIDANNSYQFYIPSAFSPDNNNHNEVFFPVVTGSNITLYTFRIYNRWGNELFSTQSVGVGWDGTFNGRPAEDGVYAWTVDMIVRGRPELISKKGGVTLLR